MGEDNGWDGGAVTVHPPRLTAVTEVERLAVAVDQFEQADERERARLLAYLVDRYGQPQGQRGRRG